MGAKRELNEFGANQELKFLTALTATAHNSRQETTIPAVVIVRQKNGSRRNTKSTEC